MDGIAVTDPLCPDAPNPADPPDATVLRRAVVGVFGLAGCAAVAAWAQFRGPGGLSFLSSPVLAARLQSDCSVSVLVEQDVIDGTACCEALTPDVFKETEGLVWIPSPPQLLFSDIKDDKIWTWMYGSNFSEPLTLVRDHAGKPNGNCIVGDRLYTTQQAMHMGVSSGGVSSAPLSDLAHAVPLVTSYGGKALGEGNDIVLSPTGELWFVDSCYGPDPGEGSGAEPEQPSGIYKLSKNGPIRMGGDDVGCPNGLAFDPEGVLYVTDSGALSVNTTGVWVYNASRPRDIRKYRVHERSLEFIGVFASIPAEKPNSFPDGIRIDGQGVVYVGAQAAGVRIYSKQGELLAVVVPPTQAISVVLGGLHLDELFIGATSAIYRVGLKTKRTLVH